MRSSLSSKTSTESPTGIVSEFTWLPPLRVLPCRSWQPPPKDHSMQLFCGPSRAHLVSEYKHPPKGHSSHAENTKQLRFLIYRGDYRAGAQLPTPCTA